MSVRRHEQQTRTSDSGHGVLGVWLPFCGAGSFETYRGGILVVVEGDAAIPGVFGPQRGVPPGWLPMLLLARSEEHTSELQSHSDLVCRLLLEKKNNRNRTGCCGTGGSIR